MSLRCSHLTGLQRAPPETTSGLSSTLDPPKRTPSAASGPIETSLEQIKSLLEEQNRTILAQSDRIGQLTADVDSLKTGSSRDKDERIRQLERQLEQSRS